MATIGYASALGSMAKDAAVGAGKGFLGGLKGAMMSEAPGLTGAYAFGKELKNRANAPKMQPGGAPPSVNQQTSTSPVMGGFGASVSLVAGQNKSNVINLEQVRQLKQLNANVVNQSKLIAFQIADQKRKDQFAEENANEQAIRDDALLQAIKQIGSRGSSGKKSSDDGKDGSSSFLGKIGDLISDNIRTLIGGYLGIKGLGAAGRVLGGIGRGSVGSIAGRAVPQIGMAGRAAASNIIDVQARVISSSAARGALSQGISTIVPMVLRFLTGPVGLGIMAAAGAGAYLYSKRDPEKAASASADFALKKLKNQPPETEGQFSKVKITQDEAKVFLEQRAEREKVAAAAEAKAAELADPFQSPKATPQQIETARKFAQGRREAVDYDIEPYGGLSRVQRVAAGEPDPGGAISTGKFLDKVRGAESGGKNIKNKAGGSAGGVYQIVDSTWSGTVAEMIKGGDKRFTEADKNPDVKFDEAKARMVAEYITEKNRGRLQKEFNRDPTETDLYMAYFMGMGDDNSGAIRFLKEMQKDPTQDAWRLSSNNADSDIINNNAEVFFESVVRDPKNTENGKYPSGKVTSKSSPRSIKAVYDLMNKRLSGAAGGNAAVVASKANPEAPITKPFKKEFIVKGHRAGNQLDISGVSPVEEYYKGLSTTPEGMPSEVTPKTVSGDKTSSSSIKSEVLKSLSGKNLNELKVSRKEVENSRLSPQYMGLTDVHKSEILKAIDEEIKNKTVSTSGAFDTLSEAQVAAMIPDFSKRYPGIQLAAGPGFNLGGGDGGGNDSIYSISGMGGGKGGGTGLRLKSGPTKVIDEANLKVNKKRLEQAKIQEKGGSDLNTQEAKAGIAQQTKVFKPLFKSNSDIIEAANKTFLQQFRRTATNAINQGLTKALFPKGVGVSAGQAGRDDMYRGQQLQKIFGTDKAINDTTTKLLGKQYGPMFAPLFNNLAQGYLEVGSRVAGKAIFQKIGKLGAEETQTLTGQVLGNFAAGNKKLALEQLLYGASGGKNGGIALGPETLFAKYGFKNPMEGISYFANALGEKATQPFAKMMGADDRSKSLTFEPRSGRYINNDTGQYATQAEINAANKDYGSRVSQTPMIDPSLNNYGVAGSPYTTTAGKYGNIPGGTTNDSLPASMGGPRGSSPMSRPQYFGITPEAQARGGERLIAEQNTLIRAQVEKQNLQIDETRRLAEAAAKREYQIADIAAKDYGEHEKARSDYDKAMSDAEVSSARRNSADEIAALDRLSGKNTSGSETPGLKAGDGRKSGQLFDSNVYGKDDKGNTIIDGKDVFKEIGNFGFDMAKNAAASALTKNIKNPYMQMIANFAINKGLNSATEAIFGKGGIDFGSIFKGGSGPEILGEAGGYGYDIVDGLESLGDAVDVGLDGFNFFDAIGLAKGGPVMGPGTGRSDSIPAMLSNGEFVVNAAATEIYRPLLDALNYTKYADGTTSTPGSSKALSTALGTDKQLSALGDQTDLLTSILGSLRVISGQGTSSGTGLAFDSGLGGVFGGGGGGGNISGGNATVVNGVARSRRTQQKPSTMDYAVAIGSTFLKGYAVRSAINAASTAIFGATPGAMAGNALISAGFPTLGTALGGSQAAVAVANGTAAAGGAAVAPLAPLAAETVVAPLAAETVATTLAAETVATTVAGGSGFGASLAAAAPPLLAFVAAYLVLESYMGGGSSAPPPKEPKYHAGIYVAGNNNINAIAPILETADYHAPPDVYKTIAYGLLRVAFNATKSSEQVTKMTASYDFIYMKVQYDKIAMIVGKGAPSNFYTQDSSHLDVLSWPAPSESTNLNALAQDIINWVRDDFKKLAKTENLSKLDTAAEGLGSYSLDEISRGLIPDLVRGKYALDQKIEKGIYANDVAESNRISSLIIAANSHKAMAESTTSDYYPGGEFGYAHEYNIVKTPAQIWSMKENKYIDASLAPAGALLLDTQGRPVYDIEGTSAGLSVEDFVSSAVAGSSRQANILTDTPASTAGGGSTTVTTVTGPKTTVDNSAITNYYNQLSTVVDSIRGATPQVG